VNSAKHRIAISSKTVTGQYGADTVLQQVNDQAHSFVWGRGALTVGVWYQGCSRV